MKRKERLRVVLDIGLVLILSLRDKNGFSFRVVKLWNFAMIFAVRLHCYSRCT